MPVTCPLGHGQLAFLYAPFMELTPLTRDLLAWIAGAPRTYRETMEAWRTSCPRLSIWEDAVSDGLVRVRSSNVELTRRGEAALNPGTVQTGWFPSGRDALPSQRTRADAAGT